MKVRIKFEKNAGIWESLTMRRDRRVEIWFGQTNRMARSVGETWQRVGMKAKKNDEALGRGIHNM